MTFGVSFSFLFISFFYLQSRDKLLRALRAMNAGDAADQVIRQVDKMIKNNERASRETRVGRVITSCLLHCSSLERKQISSC